MHGFNQYQFVLNLFTYLNGTGIEGLSASFSQVIYGEEEIAYQIGETTEILSQGYLCATPHCVRVFFLFHLHICMTTLWANILEFNTHYGSGLCLFHVKHSE